jgi:hypothetical protein
VGKAVRNDRSTRRGDRGKSYQRKIHNIGGISKDFGSTN